MNHSPAPGVLCHRELARRLTNDCFYRRREHLSGTVVAQRPLISGMYKTVRTHNAVQIEIYGAHAAQIIGSYNTDDHDHTWLWAWDNPSIEDKLKTDALKLRKYGEEHHVDRLTQRKWVGTEDDAWAMVALAVKLCGEQCLARACGRDSRLHGMWVN